MKKNLTLVTGIAFSMTILIAQACNPGGNNGPSLDPLIVHIHVKAIEMNGEMHLEMYDSNKPDQKVIDTLHTVVKPGTKVTWKRVDHSGIKKFKKIRPVNEEGQIMVEDAKRILFSKDLRLKIPSTAQPGEEKYDIVFVDKKDNKEWTIDPYLKIPD